MSTFFTSGDATTNPEARLDPPDVDIAMEGQDARIALATAEAAGQAESQRGSDGADQRQ